MYAHTLLHGPATTKEIKCVTSSKLQNTGYCKPWYSGFVPLWSLYCESWLLISFHLVYAKEEIMTENSVQNYYTDFTMVITHKQIRYSTKRLANISYRACTWQQMLVEFSRKFVEVFWTCDTHSRSVIVWDNYYQVQSVHVETVQIALLNT